LAPGYQRPELTGARIWTGAPALEAVIAGRGLGIMKITEILTAEHAVFHNLFDHIERSLPRLRTLPELKALASTLEALLRAHSQTEDELFIAPLEHCLEQIGQSDTFHEEHEEIDDNLLAVQKARNARDARKLLARAVLACREHFDKEERIVFPLAERTLKAHTLQALGAAWLKRREAALK
ncbi:MAG: hemerythrin domain-containing protein, partial [Verrucomicrobiae bacterium]|nr:hemerythrin domain-containing protein [Verrucomicrobiae bacterium]